MDQTHIGFGEGYKYRVNFYRRAHSGSAVELRAATHSPLVQKIDKGGWYGLKSKTVTIKLIAKSTVSLENFYVNDDRECLVTIEKVYTPTNAVLEFAGWLSPFDAREEYSEAPYIIVVTATCGLGSLQDFPYYNFPQQSQIENPFSLFDVIGTALYWLGYQLQLWISLAVYEEAMLVGGAAPGETYEPLKNVRIHNLHFRKDNGDWMSCYEVLEQVIGSMSELGLNCQLVQEGGVWKLIKIDEVADNITWRSWRMYSSYADETPDMGGGDPRVLVAKTGKRIIRGAELAVEPDKPKYELTVKYGNLKNLLRNASFRDEAAYWDEPSTQLIPDALKPDAGTVSVTYVGDGTASNPSGIEISGVFPLRNKKPGAAQRVPITRKAASYIPVPGRTGDIYQTISDTHRITVSGQYVNKNCGGAQLIIAAHIPGKPYYYLQEDGTWSQTGTPYLKVSNLLRSGNTSTVKPTAGESFSFSSEGVPGTGNYSIILFLFHGQDFYGRNTSVPSSIIYRNLKISVSNGSTLDYAGEFVTAELPNTDDRQRKRKTELTASISTQTSALGGFAVRYGCLLRLDGNPATRWHYFTGVTSRANKLQNLMLDGRLRGTVNRLRVFDGELVGEPGPISILYFSELNSPGVQMYMLPSTWEWDMIKRQVRVRAYQLTNYPNALTLRGEYETVDGVRLPMADPSDVASVTPPTGSGQNTAGSAGSMSGILSATLALAARIRAMRTKVILPGQPPPTIVQGGISGYTQVGDTIISVTETV